MISRIKIVAVGDVLRFLAATAAENALVYAAVACHKHNVVIQKKLIWIYSEWGEEPNQTKPDLKSAIS